MILSNRSTTLESLRETALWVPAHKADPKQVLRAGLSVGPSGSTRQGEGGPGENQDGRACILALAGCRMRLQEETLKPTLGTISAYWAPLGLLYRVIQIGGPL